MISTCSVPKNIVFIPSGKVLVHLLSKWPPRSWVAMVPNMMSIKKNKTMTSNIIGNEFRMVETKLDMLGI